MQHWGTFLSQCTQLYQNQVFPANMRQNLAFFATVPNMKQLSKNEAKTSTTIKRAKIFPKQSQPTPFSCTKNVLLLPHSCLITKFFFQVIPVVDCVTYYKKISKIATIDWVHTHLRNNKHFNFLIVVKIHLFWHFFLTYSIFKFYQLFQLAVYYRVFFMYHEYFLTYYDQ